MTRILVSGLINIETTLRIDGFPLAYNPVNYPFWGVQSRVSGVGYNLARALTTLGDEVRLLSIIGQDAMGRLVLDSLQTDGIRQEGVLALLEQTSQSVILYEQGGRRQIHCDLKNIQETAYPLQIFNQQVAGCDWLALCNINFSRPLLARAQELGKPIATDVHAIASLDAPYEQDFLQAASLLFMSHENLPIAPGEWIQAIWQRFGTPLVVIGLGAQGAMLGMRESGQIHHVPAVNVRPVVNTIGAGDALYSSFLHCFALGNDPLTALRKAVVFAAYKIGVASAADGFLSRGELENLARKVYGRS